MPIDTLTVDLKPCPFCGGEAVVDTITTAMEKKPRFRARCVKCWCKTDWDLWSADDAAEAWNRRENCDDK